MKREPIELEPGIGGFSPEPDRRPRVPEPPPVRLVAVEDVRLPTPAGIETELDSFYVGLLAFERDAKEPGVVYRAENFRLRFEVDESPVIERQVLRPQGIEIRSLTDVELMLLDREMEYSRERGITPGRDVILLRDPAGNWIELIEIKPLL